MSSTTTKVIRTKDGDCECCSNTSVRLTLEHGNIWMCESCQALEVQTAEKARAVTKIIEESAVVDSSIKIKSDVFLAKTVAAIELRAAIDNDESISADEKDYAYAQRCAERYKTLKQAIFEMRQELNERENEMRMWQVNTQTTAGKLRTEYRNQFREFDVNYQPPVIKVAKASKSSGPKAGTKKFDKAALRAVAKQYGLPESALQALVVSRNMSYEDAGKHLHSLMNPS